MGAASLALGERRIWVAGGVPYAGALALAPIVLRSDNENGFLAVAFLFVIVWTTDVGAYFVGRAVGGPKLVPQVSPNKTWAGALGGMAAAGHLVAVAVAKAAALTNLFAIAMLAVVLSVCAQGAISFESVLKRRFGAKDFEPPHPRARRADGPSRRFPDGQRRGCVHRIGARAASRPRAVACWCGELMKADPLPAAGTVRPRWNAL